MNIQRLKNEDIKIAMELKLSGDKACSVIALVEDTLAYNIEINPESKAKMEQIAENFWSWLVLENASSAEQWISANSGKALTGKEWLRKAMDSGCKI